MQNFEELAREVVKSTMEGSQASGSLREPNDMWRTSGDYRCPLWEFFMMMLRNSVIRFQLILKKSDVSSTMELQVLQGADSTNVFAGSWEFLKVSS